MLYILQPTELSSDDLYNMLYNMQPRHKHTSLPPVYMPDLGREKSKYKSHCPQCAVSYLHQSRCASDTYKIGFMRYSM